MFFNAPKCKVLRIGYNAINYDYHMMDKNGQRVKLEVSKQEKDLGVTVSSDLKPSAHIANIALSAQRVLHSIKRSFTYMDKPMFLNLYYGLVRPLVEYAVCIWNPVLRKDIIKLESVQRRATKLIACIRDLSYRQRLEYLQLPSLAHRRMRGDLIETYKLTHDLYDIPKPMFCLSRNTRTRGHRYKLVVQRSVNSARYNFFGNRIVNMWNSLPADVVDSPTVNTFKNRLDNHFKRTNYDIYEF